MTASDCHAIDTLSQRAWWLRLSSHELHPIPTTDDLSERTIVPARIAPQRDDRRPQRRIQYVPAGVEALHGRGRLACYRYSVAASVVASSKLSRKHRPIPEADDRSTYHRASTDRAAAR